MSDSPAHRLCERVCLSRKKTWPKDSASFAHIYRGCFRSCALAAMDEDAGAALAGCLDTCLDQGSKVNKPSWLQP
jgi:hypothetical protein